MYLEASNNCTLFLEGAILFAEHLKGDKRKRVKGIYHSFRLSFISCLVGSLVELRNLPSRRPWKQK